MSASSTAPRPATTGGKANNTPPSIDNRLILTAKHNKNRQPPVNQFHVGNGDMSPAAALTAVTAEVTASNNHIAKITLQQQELLKKQTQQLIQLKVQQELKKQQQQQQLQQQQQQQQQVKLQQQNKQSQQPQQQQQQRPPPPPPAAASQKPDGAKKPADNINAEQNNVNHVNAKNALNAKPNVKINNSKGTASVPLRTEPVVNLNNRAASTKAPTHVGDGSMQKAAAQPQQDQSQSASKGKATAIRKPEDNLNHQYQPTPPQLLRNGQLASAHQSVPAASTPGRPHSQQNGFIGQGLPARGQVRQPPQGQAAHNGDARATTPEERGKGKQQQESPPSDQGKGSGGKSKKTKRKNKSTGDDKFIDECFMPKSESDIEGGEMDEFERELEEFKRFCVDSTPAKREKLQVNINIKDIFSKKKPGLCN